jgi:hypothetical protein
MTVSTSTLSSNAAYNGYGGGIYNVGTLTVSACTISGNFTDFGGGGIGISLAGTLTVSTSTFNSNWIDPNGTYPYIENNIDGPYTDGGGNTFS